MKIIHKITLSVGERTYDLPKSSVLLSARFQRDEMQAWYMFDASDKEKKRITLVVNVTGSRFDDEGWTYLGSDMSKDHAFVGHVFFRREP